MGELGAPVFLHIHTHVREDAIVLYGFPTRDERRCFESLIAAHGVGPAVALALLSIHSPLALRRAVATEDAAALMLVPGVGAKTASRLLIELKTRLDLDLEVPELARVGSRGTPSTPRAEVRVALAGLGYGAEEVRDALGRLPEDGSLEDLLRSALRHLAGAR
jgi:holliday junction DNA helicase RuvA